MSTTKPYSGRETLFHKRMREIQKEADQPGS